MRAALLWIAMTACTSPDPVPEPEEEEVECPGQLEACGVRDGGWEARCSYGAVEVVDMTSTMYCKPGNREVVCEVGGNGAAIVHYCSDQCSDEIKFFDTYDEYQRFDPTTLCIP